MCVCNPCRLWMMVQHHVPPVTCTHVEGLLITSECAGSSGETCVLLPDVGRDSTWNRVTLGMACHRHCDQQVVMGWGRLRSPDKWRSDGRW